MLKDGEGTRGGAELVFAGFGPVRFRLEFAGIAPRAGGRRALWPFVEFEMSRHGHLTPVWAVTRRPLSRRCTNGSNRTMVVNATIVPEIGRVKNTVQSLEKLIIVFMNASSAIGPRITPSTNGATGNFSRSKP